jgi:small redox-active disulfide protein 2
MKIEILGTGCPKCKILFDNTQKAVEEKKIEAEIIKVEEMDKIIEFGIMSTPAIVIDNEIKSAGKVNSIEEIKEWL